MTVGRPWCAALAVLLAVCSILTACGQPTISYAPLQHPFWGATLAVDDTTQAARWQQENGADWVAPIAEQAQARWINGFTDLTAVPGYLAAAERQRAVPVLVAYFIPHRGCSDSKEGAPYSDYGADMPRPDSYSSWIKAVVAALGPRRAVVVLEPDAVAMDCFDDDRASTLRGAIADLVAARHHVYLDAGNPNWVSAPVMAERLIRAGVADAEGVSLNISNRYPTDQVARFGEELSGLLGGRDYVVDTSRNGFDGPTEPSAAADWCNRPDQALGVQTLGTEIPAQWSHMAAGLWIKPPGESDGDQADFPDENCHGETVRSGLFSPRQARQLIVNDVRQPDAARAKARAIQLPEQ